MPEPDLTSELDTAEDIVMGRAETVEVEWGVHRGTFIANYGDREKLARARSGEYGPPLRRTVTYGPWCEVNDSAPAGAVKEDGGP